MQAMYAMDVGGDLLDDAMPEVAAAAEDEAGDDREIASELHAAAGALAQEAWAGRVGADGAVAELAPDWPTHRQPPVDRAILRLAHHELAAGLAPPAVVINEAVELAKRFGAEGSPGFVNGVLDKIARRYERGEAVVEDAAEQDAPPDARAWLAEAVKGEG